LFRIFERMKFLLALIISLTAVHLSAQEGKKPIFQNGDFRLAYSLSNIASNQHQITGDYFVHENWSLVYRATLNFDQFNTQASDYTIPIGPALSVGMLGVFSCGTCSGFCGMDDGLGLLYYSMLIPDGVSYHFYPYKNITVSPYVILSGLGVYRGIEGSQFYYAPSAGCRVSYTPTHFPLSLVIEPQFRRNFESNIVPGLSTGLSITF